MPKPGRQCEFDCMHTSANGNPKACAQSVAAVDMGVQLLSLPVQDRNASVL